MLGFNPQLALSARLKNCAAKIIRIHESGQSTRAGIKTSHAGPCWLLEMELPLLGTGHALTVILDGRMQKTSWQVSCIASSQYLDQKAENKLQLARVFTEAQEGITISDANGTIIDVNPTFCALTGYAREETIGQNHRMFQSGRHDAAFYQKLWQTLQTTGHWQGEICNRKKSGPLYIASLTISAMRNESGEIVNYVGLFSDITQAKIQQQQLKKLAHHDPLTGLPNRVLFTDRFNQALAHCKRNKALLGVVYMDLDGFKQVNDNLGHDAGDQLLISVAARIKASLREEDTVSRLGGDEFALLLRDIESKPHCAQVLDRIHRAIVQPYEISGRSVTIGVSGGVTLYPLDNQDADALLRHRTRPCIKPNNKAAIALNFFPRSSLEGFTIEEAMHVAQSCGRQKTQISPCSTNENGLSHYQTVL